MMTASSLFIRLTLCAAVVSTRPVPADPMSPDGNKTRRLRRVFLSHDGGVDDFLALQILATHARAASSGGNDDCVGGGEGVLAGVAVTPADSFLDSAVNANAKVLDLVFDRSDEAVGDGCRVFAVGGARPAISSFPDAWRRACIALELLPALNGQYYDRLEADTSTGEQESRISFLNRVVGAASPSDGGRISANVALSSEAEAVRWHLCGEGETAWVEVGPLTLLAEIASLVAAEVATDDDVIFSTASARRRPLFGPPKSGACVTSVHWMGGAFDVTGNVSPFLVTPSSGKAEWNVFWDPSAANTALRAASLAGADVVVVPLDATGAVPVSRSFLEGLGRDAARWRARARNGCEGGEEPSATYVRCSMLADFAASAYALAYRGHDASYFLWDVLTVTTFLRPELVEADVRWMKVVTETSSPDAGRTVSCMGGEDDQDCYLVRVTRHIPDVDAVYSFVRESLAGLCS